MGIKRKSVEAFSRLANRFTAVSEQRTRDRKNLEPFLAWALQRVDAPGGLLFPAAYIELLRESTEQMAPVVREIKADREPGRDQPGRRFSTLLEALAHLPPVAFPVVERVGLLADSYRGNLEPYDDGHWSGDVRHHFELSSSNGLKGRILTAAARLMRSRNALELGTAYGISAVFLLEAMQANGPETKLTTVEGGRLQHGLSKAHLEARYGDRVDCVLGMTTDVLPQVVAGSGPIDLVFHDAGHSYDAYVNDFRAMLSGLAPGAVLLVDDIDWSDPRFHADDPRCHEGWMEIVGHPRVRRATEVNGVLGIALLD